MDENLTEMWNVENSNLEFLLSKCDIPEDKKDDLHWLARNLMIRNKTPEAAEAHRIIINRIKWERLRWGGKAS